VGLKSAEFRSLSVDVGADFDDTFIRIPQVVSRAGYVETADLLHLLGHTHPLLRRGYSAA
jgi:hypothetical protein